MKDKEKLLIELISALNHIGLNWYHIMEDFLEYQIEKKQKSTEHLADLQNIIMNIQDEALSFHFYH